MQLRNRNIGSTNVILSIEPVVLPVYNFTANPLYIQPECTLLGPNVTIREPVSNEKYNNEIFALLKKIMDALPPINDNDNLTQNEKFNDKIRLFRELFYIINYYDLKANPSFDKFIPVSIAKALEFVSILTIELKEYECIEKTKFSSKKRINPKNKDIYSIKEFVKELEHYISI